jgi:hypothetical protein
VDESGGIYILGEETIDGEGQGTSVPVIERQVPLLLEESLFKVARW